MTKKFDIIIIGAGPSGLMATINIWNKSILLLDANEEIGGKIKVSGGGRCNVTNNKDIDSFLKNVPKNNKFLYSTLYNFSPQDIIEYFEKNGIALKEEDHNRIFPQTDKSTTFIDYFAEKITNNKKIHLKLNYLVNKIKYQENKFIINDEYESDTLIMATGGISYPHISQGQIGHQIIEEIGHTITKLLPCESPIVSNDPVIVNKELQGITLENAIGELYINNKKKITIQKNILITHFGLSGPLALNMSYYIKEALEKKQNVFLRIYPQGQIPKRIKKHLNEENFIDITVSDIKGFKTAFVTNGGISLKEINSQTLESKIIPQLYLCGEILDVNAYTGGYNVAIALSEGKLVADNINIKYSRK